MTIRAATAADADPVARIYNPYIAGTIITFEELPVTAQEMADRIGQVAAEGLPWLVAEQHCAVVGYAYASKWKGRCAYRYSAETTVYVAQQSTRRGTGTQLYASLLALLKEKGLHVAIGGIALPNDASVALHEKFGFRKVAQFYEVGHKFGRWIDVGYWQTTL